MRIPALLIPLLFPFALLAQELEMAEPAPEDAALIAAAFADLIADAHEAGAWVQLGAARVDLDGDGADELVSIVTTPYACGAATGCQAGVFKDGAMVARLGADVITVGPGSTNGWKDLTLGMAIGEVRAVWNGQTYATP
jgi:hypothetical protein